MVRGPTWPAEGISPAADWDSPQKWARTLNKITKQRE